MKSVHTTVLLHETIDGLNLKDGDIVIDGTFGGGGHTALVCEKFPHAKVIAFDQDAGAFNKAKENVSKVAGQIAFVNDNFRNLDKYAENVGGIILDLGLSSDQLENSGRGFSFMKNEPLLMQMKHLATASAKENPFPENKGEDVTAREVVNTWEEESLADVIFGYGEEKYARRIAKGIVEARKRAPIETTTDLVKVIGDSVPALYRRGRLHFATRTFQAIRIAVNDELGALKEGLEKGFAVMKPGGRMSVISFHSLEDRVVKRFYKEKEVEEKGKLVTKKPITASKEEIQHNPRSRSAKLRIIEKI